MDIPNSFAESSDMADNILIEFHEDSISPLNKCQTSKARRICIFDVCHKLKNKDCYNIGGTYTGEEPDLWFYFTTCRCLKNKYLLNLFVHHRKPGFFAICILKALKTILYATDDSNNYSDRGNIQWKKFVSPQANVSHHIITYCLPDVQQIEDLVLSIPVVIELNPNAVINKLATQRVEKSHDFLQGLKLMKTDFILESASRTRYPTHKIILAGHSSVLRAIVKNSHTNIAFIDIDDKEMKLLLEFLTTGTIKDIEKHNLSYILELAEKFQLQRLKCIVEAVLNTQLTIENAIDFAIVCEKYKLERIQKTIFLFIRRNPKVMETEGWNNLTDVNLTKKLFKEVHRFK